MNNQFEDIYQSLKDFVTIDITILGVHYLIIKIDEHDTINSDETLFKCSLSTYYSNETFSILLNAETIRDAINDIHPF